MSGLLQERRDLRGDGIGCIFETVVANTGQPAARSLKRLRHLFSLQCHAAGQTALMQIAEMVEDVNLDRMTYVSLAILLMLYQCAGI